MRCENCGNNCPPGAKFCTKCGKEIRVRGTKSKTTTTGKAGKVLIIILIIGGILGLCAIFIPYPSNLPFIIFLVIVILIGGCCFGVFLEDAFR